MRRGPGDLTLSLMRPASPFEFETPDIADHINLFFALMNNFSIFFTTKLGRRIVCTFFQMLRTLKLNSENRYTRNIKDC